MTTDIQTVVTMDVSKKNETYNINESLLPTNLTIAAIRWLLFSRNHIEARILVLTAVFSLILKRLPDLRLWCVIGDSVWQSDTRIIRHKKLFKRLMARGVELPQSNYIVEEILEHNGKLKFFGAVQMTELAIESLVNVMAEEPCSYIIALPKEFEIKELISRGWSSSEVIDSSLLGRVAGNDGLVLKVIGNFDDPESGFVGLGVPDLVKKLRP